ncbi:hypothetical protein JW962_01055 [Candidatus Dojkabacteria bacterium]|nr:hypothetical protein [Candidatus Dojkabacteria bacterium]
MKKILKNFLKSVKVSDITTPRFIYFPTQLEDNLEVLKEFEKNGIQVLYAIKANNFIPVVESIIRTGFGFDVASAAELKLVHDLGVDKDKISFSAPTKRERDLIFSNQIGVKNYAFDSEMEIDKILRFVDKPVLFARIGTPNKLSAFDLSSKFGMSDVYFKYIVRKAKKNKWPIQGVTFHVGSQNTALSSWKDALDKLSPLLEYADHLGVKIKYLNLGGGIPAKYNGDVKQLIQYVRGICRYVNRFRLKCSIEKVFVEPGRSVVANTMALLTKVINIKPYKRPPIVVVDTSVFLGLIEALEHFEYPVYHRSQVLELEKNGSGKFYKIAGFTCDGYDIIAKRVLLPRNVQLGDLLVISCAGAYTSVYENFHMNKYPDIEIYRK